MDFTPWTQTTQYVRFGLWVVNLVIYGCAIWLYLRPTKDAVPRECPLCGSGSDVLCVGVHKAGMAPETGRVSVVGAGHALSGTRV